MPGLFQATRARQQKEYQAEQARRDKRRKARFATFAHHETGWWIKYHRNGRSFGESNRTEDKRIATRILGERLAEISTNTFVGPTHERITVGELADDLFRDYASMGGRRPMMYRLVGGCMLSRSSARAWSWKSQAIWSQSTLTIARSNTPRMPTINREMAALKRMFRMGMFATPPEVLRLPKFTKLTEHNIRTGFLEDAQYKKLIATAPISGSRR